MRTQRIAALTLAVVGVVTLDACHKKPAPQPEPVKAAGPNQDSINAAREKQRIADSIAAAQKRAADSAAAARAAAEAAARATEAARAALTAVVHFDFDKSDIRPEDQQILDAKVPVLQANPSVTIRVSGHTDERGSDEYNLALGQRRAAAVKAYLVQHGIADSRIETISYGEERPVAQGHDESAWSQNRRAEFEITAGGQSLKAP